MQIVYHAPEQGDFSSGGILGILRGRRILLGVTGSIAAYKSAELARLLVEEGAEVRAVLTSAACHFITPTTLQALTGHAVRDALFDEAHEAAMGHIELARWAERILIAPASAGFIARLAAGLADDLLSTLCLASPAPRLIAPAMNQQMWADPATRANVELLRERGARLLGPAVGTQACGDRGPGRLLDPERIVAALASDFAPRDWAGRRVLITAGPTHEAIDPVRYLANRSSGRMGFAIADAVARRGGEVTLVSGPVRLETPVGVTRVDVESARQMHAAVMRRAPGADVFIACAAVADYRPEMEARQKIKKSTETISLRLTPNPDILRDVAGLPDGPFTLGFAAETHDVTEYARVKLAAKGIDAIAANRVGGERGGFGSDENALTLLWPSGARDLEMQSKERLAHRLLDEIGPLINEKDSTEAT